MTSQRPTCTRWAFSQRKRPRCPEGEKSRIRPTGVFVTPGLLALAVLVFGLCPALAGYSGGSGTAADPFRIGTPQDLLDISNSPDDWDNHFVLIADIDMSDHVFDRAVIAPDIDAQESGFQGTPFLGQFDGGGHSIRRLVITTASAAGYLGFFGLVESSASVTSVHLPECQLNVAEWQALGALAGANYGTISSCTASVNLSLGSSVADAAGLVGLNEGLIEECHVEIGGGTCTERAFLAGLVASNGTPGAIMRCSAHGQLRSQDGGVGGLVRYNFGLIQSSFASVDISSPSRNIGGLVGMNLGGSIRFCYATGPVSGGDRYVAGLVGYNAGSVVCCYSTGPVTASQGATRCGGLIGSNLGLVSKSFWDTQSSGMSSSAAGVAKTTLEMRQMETFRGWGRFWKLDENRDYPRLLWEDRPGLPVPYFPYADGAGTAQDPLRIRTASQFHALGVNACDWDKHIVLEADIAPGQIEFFHSIGDFIGTFDGRGHTVSGALIEATENYAGLFRLLGSGGAIQNLTVEDITISGTGIDRLGALAGAVGGTVRNCIVAGRFIADSDVHMVGGLVGLNAGDITDCHANVDLDSGANCQSVGALAGKNGGWIQRCSARGTLNVASHGKYNTLGGSSVFRTTGVSATPGPT